MPCYHLLSAHQRGHGTPLSFQRAGEPDTAFRLRCGRHGRYLGVPCGQCIGCRLERSRQWAVRCMHEAALHEFNSFITLTFDDDHCPHSLDRIHFQKFIRALRKKRGKCRYYMCGEYGDEKLRPHYHACLFGMGFLDRYHWRNSPSGFPLFRSPSLESLWRFGSCEIGDVTFESAAYVARYVLKKMSGDKAAEHYESFSPYTGEIFVREPEFVSMSLKPGIGAGWFDKFQKEVYPRDEVRVNDSFAKPPKYYDKLFNAVDPFEFRIIQHHRVLEAEKHVADCTPRRLAARETVARARLKFKVRSLE